MSPGVLELQWERRAFRGKRPAEGHRDCVSNCCMADVQFIPENESALSSVGQSCASLPFSQAMAPPACQFVITGVINTAEAGPDSNAMTTPKEMRSTSTVLLHE
jgi:hypothetical protein